jgi:Zinc carboxypeptidase
VTDDGPKTVAELSGFLRTGRYAEVQQLCDAFARTWPEVASPFEFGRTPEGRPMLALLVTRTGVRGAEEAKSRGIPVLMLQGAIHPGECDGKDAGFIALREIIQGRASAEALERIAIVFVPVFNVDGHERFGRWNRPNQRGPEETGWRTTAQNLDLNRDYAKADAPEMQAMLKLLGGWDPILFVDLHATNGADFEHDIAVVVEPIYQGDSILHAASRDLQNELIRSLAEQGSLPLPFYPSLIRNDPSIGFADAVYSPRFSTGYSALCNRLAVLIETHSWKDYPVRVRITRNAIVALTELTTAHGQRWLHLKSKADANAKQIRGSAVALDFMPSTESDTIEFRGYQYTRRPSAISGGLATQYNPSVPQIWKVPLRKKIEACLTVEAPAGYIVPPAYAEPIGMRLGLHGISFQLIPQSLPGVAVETFRATQVVFAARPFEGRMTAALQGSWALEIRNIAAGSLYVPVGQHRARLLLALLEPRGPDSFAAWGFFNAVFERKEYMEPYVAEQVAIEMLAGDQALAEEFSAKLIQDPAFASDAAARLDFFYRRHTSWDERFNLYPIYRDSTGKLLLPL